MNSNDIATLRQQLAPIQSKIDCINAVLDSAGAGGHLNDDQQAEVEKLWEQLVALIYPPAATPKKSDDVTAQVKSQIEAKANATQSETQGYSGMTTSEIDAKLATLVGKQGPFVFFAHPAGHETLDPVLRFHGVSAGLDLLISCSGGTARFETFTELAQALADAEARGTIICGFGVASDYEGDNLGTALVVPTGYHAVAPTTQHPGDGSRDWLATDFWTFEPDLPPAA